MQSDAALLPLTSMCFPGGQSMQSDGSSLPAMSTYLPALQSMQCDAVSLPLASANFPAVQSMQSDSDSLPTTSKYFPGAQSKHLPVAPATSAYVPAGQCTEHSLDPAVEYLPTPHSAHVTLLWYLPAGQASQLRTSDTSSGHDTAQASYAVMPMLPLESVPTAQGAAHMAAPGPSSTKAVHVSSSPRSVYIHPGSSLHVVQHSAAVHGSPAHATDSGGNTRSLVPAGQMNKLWAPSPSVSAQVRRCPGGVHPRKVALAGHEIAQASYAMTLAPPNVVPTAHSSSHVAVPAALTNSEHPLYVPS
jgi:hypothetical protein